MKSDISIRLVALVLALFSPTAFGYVTCHTTCHSTVQRTLDSMDNPADVEAYRETCNSMGGHLTWGGGECGPSTIAYCVANSEPLSNTGEGSDLSSEYTARSQARSECTDGLPDRQIDACTEYYSIGSPIVDETTCVPN